MGGGISRFQSGRTGDPAGVSIDDENEIVIAVGLRGRLVAEDKIKEVDGARGPRAARAVATKADC